MRPGIGWLLASADPSVRYLAKTELLGEDASEELELIPKGRRVRALLHGQRADGSFGVHPYSKWTGSFWRLISLVELGIPADHPKARRAAEDVLRWIGADRKTPVIEGRARAHTSQEGRSLGCCARLGLAHDERVVRLASNLTEWQWPDGGWNCDSRPEARHSSVHESWGPVWGLAEFHRATGDPDALEAACKGAEFFLRHRLVNSCRTGKLVNPNWLKLHYPPYWHYDVLQGLRVLAAAGTLDDDRAQPALDGLEKLRRPDAAWRAGGYHWRPLGKAASGVDVADWGRGGPNEMITLQALTVLEKAGRL